MAAGGISLGNAWLNVVPSTKGFTRTITTALGGASKPAGKKLSGGLLGAAAPAFRKIGALGTAAAGAVVTGFTLKGGIDRALGIEDAKAKLAGLGHSAGSIEKIMDSTSKAIEGTPYLLSDTAAVAAQMVATGIKSGKDLQSTLASVADVATISGRSITDVGSIFASVAARGKLQGDDMLQLMSAGVPVLQALGKVTGKTAAQVSDMVSSGQIDFATFQKAMEGSMGGAAKATNTTFRGAWMNVKAYLSHIGEAAASPVLNALRDTMNRSVPAIDNFARVSQPAFDRFGAAIERNLPKALDQIGNLGRTVAEAADVIHGWWTGEGTDVEAWWSEPLGEATAVVKDALDAVATAARGLWDAMSPLMVEIAKVAGAAALGALIAALQIVTPILQGLGDSMRDYPAMWQSLAVAVGGAVLAFKGLNAVGGWLTAAGILSNLHNFGLGVRLAFISLGDGVGIMGKLSGALGYLKEGFGGLFKAMQALPGVIGWVSRSIAGIFRLLAANPIVAIIAGIVALVGAFIYAYTHSEKFRDIVNKCLHAVADAGRAVGAFFSGPFLDFFRNMWSGIVGIFTTVKDWVVGVATSIGAFFTGPFVGFFTSMWNGVVSVFSGIGSFFSGVWNGVVVIFVGFKNTAVNVWNSLWATISNSWTFRFISTLLSITFRAWLLLFHIFGAVLRVIWTTLWNDIKIVAVAVWHGISSVISGALRIIGGFISARLAEIRRVWTTVWNGIKLVAGVVWRGISSVISAVFRGIVGFVRARLAEIKWVWTTVWNGIKWVASTVWHAIWSVISSILGPIVNFISTRITMIKRIWTLGFEVIRNVAARIMDSVSSKISNILSGIRSAFSAAIEAIKKIWDGLKNAVKAPINFVINNVINTPFISGIKHVAKMLGASDKITEVPTFATGGYVDMPWSASNRDPYLGMTPSGPIRFEGQEFIVNRRSTRRYRPLLEAINSNSVPGYAGGGVVGGKGRWTPLFAREMMMAAQMLHTTLSVAQRGFRPKTPWSGSSHKGDAVDVTGPGAPGNLWRIRDALRRVGMAAWVRGPKQRFPWHVHAIPMPGHGTALGTALYQQQAYARGGDGLHGFEKDVYAGASDVRGGSILGAIGAGIKNLFGKFATPMEWLKDKVSGAINGAKSVVHKMGSHPWIRVVGQAPQQAMRWAMDWVKRKFEAFSPSSDQGASSNMETWRPLVRRALAASGIGGGKSDEDKWLKQINTESSGNPRLVQSSALRDINVRRGDPARGLVQVPGVTWADFGRDMGPFIPNVYDPLKNLIVGMRAASRQHRNWRRVIGFGHGYAAGGNVFRDVLAPVAERGPELVVGPQLANLQARSRVFNAHDTAAMMSGPQRIVGTLDITENGQAVIYGIAQDAINDRQADMARMGAL